MKLRSDYRAADIMKDRLHHESEEPIEKPIHPSQQRRIRRGQEIFSKDYLSSARIDQHTIHDLDDGFGGAGARREHTLHRDDEESVPVGWIRGYTKISPVREVKVTNHLEHFGLCEQNTLTRAFSRTHFILVHMHRTAQGVVARVFVKRALNHMSSRV